MAIEGSNVKTARYSYGQKQIDSLRVKFDELPVVENYYCLKDVIIMLEKQIHSMREKGYTYETIVGYMKSMGIELSVSTLITTLRSIKSGQKKLKKGEQLSSKGSKDQVSVATEVKGDVESSGLDADADALIGDYIKD